MMGIATIVLAAMTGSDTGSGSSLRLPTSLAEDFPLEVSEESDVEIDVFEQYRPPPPPPGKSTGSSTNGFSLGPAGGYLHAKGADRGTWFAGAQARFHFLNFLAVEAAATFHDNSYEGGDVHVTQYPVQLSGLIYPFPSWMISPYLLGGGGWYYSRVTYSGALSATSDQTEHTFGAHAGAGADLRLGPSIALDADLRYIFLNPTGTQVKHGDFNYWQVTAGLNFQF
jgi:hypothetical protein